MPDAIALFTLVGIAGEDDIDAPISRVRCPGVGSCEAGANEHKLLNGGEAIPPNKSRPSRCKSRLEYRQANPRREMSAILREELVRGNSRQLLHLTTPPSGHIGSLTPRIV